MKRSHLSRIANPTMADMIASATNSRGREVLPLSYHPRKYIDAEAMMLKIDKQVAAELEKWEREIFP